MLTEWLIDKLLQDLGNTFRRTLKRQANRSSPYSFLPLGSILTEHNLTVKAVSHGRYDAVYVAELAEHTLGGTGMDAHRLRYRLEI